MGYSRPKIWTPTELGLSAVSMTATGTTTGTLIDVGEYDYFLLLIYLNAGGAFPTAMTVRVLTSFAEGTPVDSPTMYLQVAGANPFSDYRNPVGWYWGRNGSGAGDWGSNAIYPPAASAPNPYPMPSYKFQVNVSTVGSGAATCSLRLFAKRD